MSARVANEGLSRDLAIRLISAATDNVLAGQSPAIVSQWNELAGKTGQALHRMVQRGDDETPEAYAALLLSVADKPRQIGTEPIA